jgi:hypothetical protein
MRKHLNRIGRYSHRLSIYRSRGLTWDERRLGCGSSNVPHRLALSKRSREGFHPWLMLSGLCLAATVEISSMSLKSNWSRLPMRPLILNSNVPKQGVKGNSVRQWKCQRRDVGHHSMEGPRHLNRVTYSVKGTSQCRLTAVDREMPQIHGLICTSITPVRQKEDFSGLQVSDWVRCEGTRKIEPFRSMKVANVTRCHLCCKRCYAEFANHPKAQANVERIGRTGRLRGESFELLNNLGAINQNQGVR